MNCSRGKSPVSDQNFGPDLAVLSERPSAHRSCRENPRCRRCVIRASERRSAIGCAAKRELLARYGISVDQVMSLVSQGIGGASAGQVIDGNARYDINVRLAAEFRTSPDAIKDLLLPAARMAPLCA